MNFQVKYKQSEIALNRSKSLFVPLTLIVAGILCLLANAIILDEYDFYEFPNSLQSFTASFIGIVLIGLGWFIPNYFESNFPQSVVFDKKRSQVFFKKNDSKEFLAIPINHIANVEIEEEKRKASASNSARIHDNRHHVILVWKNSVRWYLAESEELEEANTLISNLKAYMAECNQLDGELIVKLSKSFKIDKNADTISVSWKNNRSLQMAMGFFILNTMLAALLWWMVTREDEIATSVFIILGIIFFTLLALLTMIGPALYHEASTKHLISISKGLLRYTEASRFSGKIKLEKQTSLEDIVQIGYTFSPLDLKMNNRIQIKSTQSKNSFTIHMPNSHPVECLSMEHWIKLNLLSNR
jgi:hypothetical protein